MSTYKELLQSARRILQEQKIVDADVDAWYLLSYVLGINRTDFLLHSNKIAEDDECIRYMELVSVRADHVPLQYITGTQEFMGLEFTVTPDVLIPRQDTEILVEEVLKICDGKAVLDMCTGSGCIIISSAKLRRPVKAVGVDISKQALKVAAENAVRHGVEVELINSDLFERVEGYYDIIVSNPPYIPTEDINELMPEVKNHEPVLALDGDKDGLSFYRQIIAGAMKHLNSNGRLLFEIGYNQGSEVRDILISEGFTDVIIKKDLSGLDRVVTAVRS